MACWLTEWNKFETNLGSSIEDSVQLVFKFITVIARLIWSRNI